MTSKPSLREWGGLDTSSAEARDSAGAPRKVSQGPSAMAEGRVIDPAPRGAVRRRQRRRRDTDPRRSPQGRTRTPPCRSQAQGTAPRDRTGLRRV